MLPFCYCYIYLWHEQLEVLQCGKRWRYFRQSLLHNYVKLFNDGWLDYKNKCQVLVLPAMRVRFIFNILHQPVY